MTERIAFTARAETKEIPTTDSLLGLKTRLLIGTKSSLNPNNLNLLNIFPKDIDSQEGKVIDHALRKSSLSSRYDYWSDKKEHDSNLSSYEMQMKSWKNSWSKFLNSNQGKETKNIFFQLMNIKDKEAVEEEEIMFFYQKYCSNKGKQSIDIVTREGKKKVVDTGVVEFVENILSLYEKDNSKFDYEKFSQDLPHLSRLSRMHGVDEFEEILSTYLEGKGEIKDEEKKKQLIEKANHESPAPGEKLKRMNNLNERELIDLKYLWEKAELEEEKGAAETAPVEKEIKPPLPEYEPQYKYEWQYQKLGDPRVFPESERIKNFTNPKVIAATLKETYKDQFNYITEENLAKEIIEEQNLLANYLQSVGLTGERMMGFISSTINDYQSFIEKKYGLKLPRISKVNVIPIWGKTASLWNPGRKAFAFVKFDMPAIFLDMGVINDEAKKIGVKELRSLKKEQVGKIIERLLEELNPHEYTHLTGEIAFWTLLEKENGKVNSKLTLPGKGGLMLVKPKTRENNGQKEIGFKERGRGLMEAVTVELTNQWVHEKGKVLDLQAYARERKVLSILVNKLVSEESMSPEEVFLKFVKGYFTSNGYQDLIYLANGRQKENGKITQKRPHFLEIIYALMEHELAMGKINGKYTDYPTTIHFINNSLDYEDKTTIQDLLDRLKINKSTAQLSQTAVEILEDKLSPLRKAA